MVVLLDARVKVLQRLSRYDDWQQPLHLEENNALQRLAVGARLSRSEPLIYFRVRQGPSFGLACVGRSTSAFDGAPHGLSSREKRNSRRIKGTRGFCDEGVEGLNRVYANRLFL